MRRSRRRRRKSFVLATSSSCLLALAVHWVAAIIGKAWSSGACRMRLQHIAAFLFEARTWTMMGLWRGLGREYWHGVKRFKHLSGGGCESRESQFKRIVESLFMSI